MTSKAFKGRGTVCWCRQHTRAHLRDHDRVVGLLVEGVVAHQRLQRMRVDGRAVAS